MDENSNINVEANAEQSVEPPSVPTENQEKLRRRYGRMTGWYGSLAFLFFLLAAYNVIQGLNNFASPPMFIELGLGIALTIPAFWATRRRARLDEYVSEGSTLMPRHMKTWQHLSILLIAAPAGLLAISFLVVTVLAATSAQSEEAARGRETTFVRERVNASLDGESNIANVCAKLANPGGKGELRQQMAKFRTYNPIYLTIDEVNQVRFEATIEYCGLSQ